MSTVSVVLSFVLLFEQAYVEAYLTSEAQLISDRQGTWVVTHRTFALAHNVQQFFVKHGRLPICTTFRKKKSWSRVFLFSWRLLQSTGLTRQSLLPYCDNLGSPSLHHDIRPPRASCDLDRAFSKLQRILHGWGDMKLLFASNWRTRSRYGVTGWNQITTSAWVNYKVNTLCRERKLR